MASNYFRDYGFTHGNASILSKKYRAHCKLTGVKPIPFYHPDKTMLEICMIYEDHCIKHNLIPKRFSTPYKRFGSGLPDLPHTKYMRKHDE